MTDEIQEAADNLAAAIQRWLAWRERGHGDGIEAKDAEKALNMYFAVRRPRPAKGGSDE